MPGDRLQRILAELSAGGSSWTASRLCAVIPELAGVDGAGVMLMSGDVPRGSLCVRSEGRDNALMRTQKSSLYF